MIYKPEKRQATEIESFIKQIKRDREQNRYKTSNKEINIQALQVNLKKEIQQNIDKIVSIFQKYDFESLMNFMGLWVLTFYSNKEFLEESGGLKNKKIEYLLNLATSLDSVGTEKLEDNTTEELQNLLNSLFELLGLTPLLIQDSFTQEQQGLLARSYLKELLINGDSVEQHHIDLSKSLYQSQDRFFRRLFNLTGIEVFDYLESIVQTTPERFRRYISVNEKALGHYKIFNTFVKEQEQLGKTIPEIHQLYLESQEFKTMQQEIEPYKDDYVDNNFFEIKEDREEYKELIELLSMEIGENRDFIKSKDRNIPIDYFPLNHSDIRLKPFIKYENRVFMFAPSILSYSYISMLENLIKTHRQKKELEKYTDSRGKLIEDLSITYFKNIFGDKGEYYSSLYYSPCKEVCEDNKEKDQCELDGLVIFDGNIFLLESKANNYSTKARKGHLQRLKNDLKDIVDKAYCQGIRAKNFIQSNDKVVFYNKRKQKIVEIEKSSIRNIFLVNPTIEKLSFLSSQINLVKSLGLLNSNEWLWSLFINDFRVISELIESPSIFIAYLTQRLSINSLNNVVSFDELDLFGLFLEQGHLNFNSIDEFQEIDMFTISSHTDKIFNYYLSGFYPELNIEAEKPTFQKKRQLLDFLHKIESSNIDGFSEVINAILQIDEDDFLKALEKAKNNFSLPIEDLNFGFTYSKTQPTNEYIESFMYQYNISKWYLVTEIDNIISLKIFNNLSIDKEVLVEQLEELKFSRFKQIEDSGLKIGRNELCPCGSGKKYKKCCLNNSYLRSQDANNF